MEECVKPSDPAYPMPQPKPQPTPEEPVDIYPPPACPPPETCDKAFPGWHKCSDYPYGSATGAIAAYLGGDYTTYTPKKADKCGVGGGTHYLVKHKLIKDKVASVLCCNCCKDTPAGPKTSRGCKFIPG